MTRVDVTNQPEVARAYAHHAKRAGAGKGDAPRNCFSKAYRDNYDAIRWDSTSSGSTFTAPPRPYRSVWMNFINRNYRLGRKS